MLERRKFRRVQLPAYATAFTGNETLQCEVEDLSASGAALRVEHGCEAGRFVRLLIRVSSDFVLDVDAVVVRCAPSGGRSIWGAAFVGLDESRVGTLLRALAAHLRVESTRATNPPPASRATAASPPTQHPANPIDAELRALYRAAVVEVEGELSTRTKRRA